MPVAGFHIEKIHAEKTAELTKDIKDFRIKPSIAVTNLEKKPLDNLDKEKQAIQLNFDFSLDYYPKIGKIQIAGNLVFIDETKIVNKLLSEWKKSQKLPQDTMTILLNTVHLRSTLKALQLEQEVGLPPHISLPILTPATKRPENYIG